jgi:hypothetical protein
MYSLIFIKNKEEERKRNKMVKRVTSVKEYMIY